MQKREKSYLKLNTAHAWSEVDWNATEKCAEYMDINRKELFIHAMPSCTVSKLQLQQPI